MEGVGWGEINSLPQSISQPPSSIPQPLADHVDMNISSSLAKNPASLDPPVEDFVTGVESPYESTGENSVFVYHKQKRTTPDMDYGESSDDTLDDTPTHGFHESWDGSYIDTSSSSDEETSSESEDGTSDGSDDGTSDGEDENTSDGSADTVVETRNLHTRGGARQSRRARRRVCTSILTAAKWIEELLHSHPKRIWRAF